MITENRERSCRNCGTAFTVVHQLIEIHGNGGRVYYCSDLCRMAADRNRRRARRAQRNALAAELAQRASERESHDDDDSWPVLNRNPGCLNCRKPIRERYDGYFAGSRVSSHGGPSAYLTRNPSLCKTSYIRITSHRRCCPEQR
jgi:hypothetical protein